MSPLDIHINDGFLPMVDGTRVYHRGFGDRRTLVNDPKPSLTISPRVFLRNGSLVASRTYPLKATIPPLGRPAPAAKDPANPGEFLVRRAFWASFFPDRTLIAETGSTISLRVTNHLAQEHALQFLNAGAGNSHVEHRRDPARSNQNLGIPGPQSRHLPLLRSWRRSGRSHRRPGPARPGPLWCLAGDRSGLAVAAHAQGAGI